MISFGFVTNESSSWVCRWPWCARPSRSDSNFSKRPTPTETDRTTNRCARTSPAGGESDRILSASRAAAAVGTDQRSSLPFFSTWRDSSHQETANYGSQRMKSEVLANGLALPYPAFLENGRRHEAIFKM